MAWGSFWPDRTITATAQSPNQRYVVATVMTLSEESDDNSGIKFIIKSTETTKTLTETPLVDCRPDVRHLEVSWKSDEASILCGNGQFFKVELASGNIIRQINLGHKWQGNDPEKIDIKLWLARHSLSKQQDLLFAAGSGGTYIWKISDK